MVLEVAFGGHEESGEDTDVDEHAVWGDFGEDLRALGRRGVEAHAFGDVEVLRGDERTSEERGVVAHEGFEAFGNAGGFFGEGDIDDLAVLGVTHDVSAESGDDRGEGVDFLTLVVGEFGDGSGGGEEVLGERAHFLGNDVFATTLGSGGLGDFKGLVAEPSDLEEAFAEVAVNGPGAFDCGGGGGDDCSFARPNGVALTGADGEAAVEDFAELRDDFALIVVALGDDGGEVFEDKDAGFSHEFEEGGFRAVLGAGEEGFCGERGFDPGVGKSGGTVDDDGSFAGTAGADDEEPHGVAGEVLGVTGGESAEEGFEIGFVEVLVEEGCEVVPLRSLGELLRCFGYFYGRRVKGHYSPRDGFGRSLWVSEPPVS